MPFGQVEQVHGSCLIELECADEGEQHAFGHPTKVSTLHPGVTGRAHAGDLSDFLTTTARQPPLATEYGQAGLFQSDARATVEEPLHVVTSAHTPDATPLSG